MGNRSVIKDTAGVILTGGQSSRFGSNKALADFRGLPLIQRVRDIIAPLFAEKLLITNSPEIYRLLGWPMQQDLFPGHGPLAGIQAALAAADAPYCFVTACDMPFLAPALIAYLCGLATPEWDAVLPWPAQGPEPLHAVYCKSALPVITENLRGDRNQITQALEKLRVRRVSQEELMRIVPDLTTFYNINRHEEMLTALGQRYPGDYDRP